MEKYTFLEMYTLKVDTDYHLRISWQRSSHRIGERIVHVGSVPKVNELQKNERVRIIEGRGRTLMSGLGDTHTHLTWNNSALDKLADVGVEEHTLMTAKSAQCYLDSGYTMCFGAASAKD